MTDSPQAAPVRRGPRTSVKIAFLVLALLIAAGIVVRQKYLPVPKGGWIDNDLDKAFQIAKDEDRNLLVLFVNKTPSQTDRDLRNTTLSKSKNIEAIQEHNLVAVMVRVSPSQRREVFETYEIKSLPTMLILDAEGNELAREEGKVGEVAFAQEFLPSATAPQTPKPKPPHVRNTPRNLRGVFCISLLTIRLLQHVADHLDILNSHRLGQLSIRQCQREANLDRLGPVARVPTVPQRLNVVRRAGVPLNLTVLLQAVGPLELQVADPFRKHLPERVHLVKVRGGNIDRPRRSPTGHAGGKRIGARFVERLDNLQRILRLHVRARQRRIYRENALGPPQHLATGTPLVASQRINDHRPTPLR